MTEAQAHAARRPDAGRMLIVIGLVLAAFLASYAYAQSISGDRIAEASGPETAAQAACACCGGGDAEPVEGATVIEGDVQTVFVDASSSFVPNVIHAQADVPFEITFSEGQGCMAEVYFPDFGIFEDLTHGGTTVELPALAPGEYGFSCGMQMVFGTLVVE